jgi:hypothetical protein
MTTLTLKSLENKEFESIGCMNRTTDEYDESTLFPKGTIVKLTDGKFPFTDYKDLYEHSGSYYKMGNTNVKLVGFCISSTENNLEQYGPPTIVVTE